MKRRHFVASLPLICLAPRVAVPDDVNCKNPLEAARYPDECFIPDPITPTGSNPSDVSGFICSFDYRQVGSILRQLHKQQCPVQNITYRGYGESELKQAMRAFVDHLGHSINRYALSERPGLRNAVAYSCQKSNGEIAKAVVWDPNFLFRLSQKAGTYVGALAILAHEIAHHINGDTNQIKDLGPRKRKEQELQADFWAGKELAKLGYGERDTVAIFSTLGSGGATHPPAELRVRAASAGWRHTMSRASGPGWGNVRGQFGFH